jgi:hypothetical protein
LEVLKAFKNLRFVFESIDPNKVTEIIYEAYIILFVTNRLRGRAPNIRKTSSRGTLEIL